MATIQISKGLVTDIVHSPDDGGWYVQQTKRKSPYESRTSREIYPSHSDACNAYLYGDVTWTKWD
jgi:hypothetical protein